MISASKILLSLKHVSEEYHALYKGHLKGNPYPVFTNPSYQEMFKELGPLVRFSADSQTRTVYVWNWESELHPHFRKAAGITCPRENEFMFWCNLILEGVAEARGGKYFMIESDGLEGKIMSTRRLDQKQLFTRSILEKDWFWVDRYIEVTPFLEKLSVKMGL